MRDDLDRGRSLEQRDLTCDGEAAAARHVRLENVDSSTLDERPKRGEGLVGLAGGDSHRGLPGEQAVTLEIVGLERFLEPVEAMLLDAAQQLERTFHRVRPPSVDHQGAICAKRLTGNADELLIEGKVAAERPPPELECAVARLDRMLCDPTHVVGRAGHHLARVDRDTVEAATPEKLRNRATGGLAGQVPQSDVDGADHVQRRTASPVVIARVEEALPETVDLQRVFTDQHLAQPASDRMGRRHLDDRPREQRGGVGLADADDPLVGMDAHEKRILRPVCPGRVDLGEPKDDRLDVGDLHSR